MDEPDFDLFVEWEYQRLKSDAVWGVPLGNLCAAEKLGSW